jgi:selenide,water dikinase
VDDARDWGRIAAANALSDVYAMGGRPVVALNLTAWPGATLPLSILADVLRGGASVAAQAGCLVVGGHTIDDPEPKYGLAVTGVIDPADLITNAGAQAGDALVLTKPVGAGAITTALKKGLADEWTLARAVEVMTELNAAAAAAAQAVGAHAMTDVTGFGLLGHLHELTLASGVAAVVEATDVPAIEGARELLEDERAIAGGSRNNRRYAEEFASFAVGVDEVNRRLVTDAMTSGGLLVAVAADRAAELPGTVIGRLVDGEAGTIEVM